MSESDTDDNAAGSTLMIPLSPREMIYAHFFTNREIDKSTNRKKERIPPTEKSRPGIFVSRVGRFVCGPYVTAWRRATPR